MTNYALSNGKEIGPTPRAYWVLDGKFIAGAYPGKKDSGELGGRPEVTQQLLDAGVEVFINLTEDQLGKNNSDAQLDQYDKFVSQQAVVERHPIRDLDIPTHEEMCIVLDAIDAHLAENKVVYLHCWGGFGRTGTVLGCWLRRNKLATSDSVQEIIDDLRKGAVDGQHRESPEMPLQRQYIKAWSENKQEMIDALQEGVVNQRHQTYVHAKFENETGISEAFKNYDQHTSRVVGSLLGGAIGDALGAALEFYRLGEIENAFGKGGATTFTPAYGLDAAITDDTQMTLFTAEGLIEARKNNADPITEVWEAYRRWYYTQREWLDDSVPENIDTSFGLLNIPDLHNRRAPGLTCTGSIAKGTPGSSSVPLNNSKGCGGIMRVAPVGLCSSSVEEAYRIGCETAALTHGHPDGWIPAGVQAAIIHQIMEGDELLDAIIVGRQMASNEPQGENVVKAIDAAINLALNEPYGELDGWDLETLGGAWVGEEALAITIAVALAEEDINKALLLSVNHSGDSDSTGSMVGNILGALHGVSALRPSWCSDVEISAEIIELAEQLAQVNKDAN